MGEETTYLVGFGPGKYYRIAVVRLKYEFIDPMEPVERGKGVLIALLPKFPIHKGMPDASLLTETICRNMSTICRSTVRSNRWHIPA